METIKVFRQRDVFHDGTRMPQFPTRGTPGAAGYDLRAYIPSDGWEKFIEIPPGETCLIPTGLFFEIPPGFEVQVRSRSGLARGGIVVANSPATFDSDYRGEVLIILRNGSDTKLTVRHGERVAQMVFQRVPEFVFEEVQSLADFTPTERGDGRHGSTGIR